MREVSVILDANGAPLGTARKVFHHIYTDDERSLGHRPYQASSSERETIETEVDTMLVKRIIIPSDSSCSSPVVLVTKNEGSIRFCVDYLRLNKVTRKYVYPCLGLTMHWINCEVPSVLRCSISVHVTGKFQWLIKTKPRPHVGSNNDARSLASAHFKHKLHKLRHDESHRNDIYSYRNLVWFWVPIRKSELAEMLICKDVGSYRLLRPLFAVACMVEPVNPSNDHRY